MNFRENSWRNFWKKYGGVSEKVPRGICGKILEEFPETLLLLKECLEKLLETFPK